MTDKSPLREIVATPRTDELAERCISIFDWRTEYTLMKEHARQLERELRAKPEVQEIVATLPEPEIVGWIEHHKGGDNINWERVDHPYAQATPLIRKSDYDALRAAVDARREDTE